MNKHGQTLIIMVILVPIFLLLFMVIIENANIYYQKHRAISVTKTIITKALLKNEKDDIINIYKDNKIDVNNLTISYEEGMNIKFSFEVDSLINGIIENNYEINIDLTGYLDDDKVKFKKG